MLINVLIYNAIKIIHSSQVTLNIYFKERDL